MQMGGDLADGHAMPGGEGVQPDKALEARLQHGPLYLRATDRIGPVQHRDWYAQRLASLHTERHAPDERVVAGADVGDIDHEALNSAKHLRRRLPVLAVEGVDHQA